MRFSWNHAVFCATRSYGAHDERAAQGLRATTRVAKVRRSLPSDVIYIGSNEGFYAIRGS
jgi:hypothetical protein